MTNTKLLAGGVIVALAISAMIVLPTLSAYAADFTTVTSGTKSQNGNALHLSVTTGASIPRFPGDFPSGTFTNTNLVFGYAWADLSSGNAIVSAIHPAFQDSTQNPNAWHTHPVTLGAGAAYDFCITSIGQDTSGSEAGISMSGNSMKVSISASKTGLSADNINAVAAFEVHPDPGCTGTAAPSGSTIHLGVKVLSAQGL